MLSLAPTLVAFIRAAKQATYAAQGGVASVEPRIAGSKQLEFRDGPLTYHDIYVGMSRFVGQEMVFENGRPIWSMSYAGGVRDTTSPDGTVAIYAHLRAALLLAPTSLPVRGPAEHVAGDLRYTCQAEGDLTWFQGLECITSGARTVYELRFSGGLLR